MARADRLERVDIRRAALEADYLEVLTAALRKAASGIWGLFGHTQDRVGRAKFAPMVEQLENIGEEIDDLRGQLELESFELHRRFLASRGPVSSDRVGEPKQAQAWLDRL